MASANLELVRSIWTAWERGDFSSAGWAHPEIEFALADLPAAGSWTGLAEMAKAWGGFLSAWEELRAEGGEYRELDDERVLVLAQFSARGKSSGLEVGQIRWQAANLFHIRAGRVTRLVIYFDHEHALADVGLATDADAPRS